MYTGPIIIDKNASNEWYHIELIPTLKGKLIDNIAENI